MPLIDGASDQSVPLEIYVLKAHLMVEVMLYRILAARLETEEHELPSLQFFQLAKLALGGHKYKAILVLVLGLNDLRNEYSHELNAERLTLTHSKFVIHCGFFWPEFDVIKNPKMFNEIREAAIRAAAHSCVTEVTCALRETAVDSEPETGAAHVTVEETRANLASMRKGQLELRRWFEENAKTHLPAAANVREQTDKS